MRDDLASFIPQRVGSDGIAEPIAIGRLLPTDDLFTLTDAATSRTGYGTIGAKHGNHAAFDVRNDLTLTVDLQSVRASHVQCLLAHLAQGRTNGTIGPLQSTVIDYGCKLTLWANDQRIVRSAQDAWERIRTSGNVDRATTMTTPWIYGNKLRLTRFIAPIASTALPDGAPVLDLMSGTGIVARALSERHPMAINDANPYAVLFSRNHWAKAVDLDVSTIGDSLRGPFSENQQRLEALVSSVLSEESALLHGETDDVALDRYRDLRDKLVLPMTDGTDGSVARLATERYAGVYFGIAQTVEIDSLRYAIEQSFCDTGPQRDACLNALMVACITCASGPHFAQPTNPKSVRSLRVLMERRARSVTWEFELALGRLASRVPPRNPLIMATCGSWREALSSFADQVDGQTAGVYIDPPYSKLQYSRYYHVLNVLLSYNYPPVAGKGRYPPRQDRFSSRFEYQPGVSKRELSELIRACADAGMTTMLSYGDAGFVSISGLLKEMGAAFRNVQIFTEPLRHHSQGRALASARSVAMEHLIVGRPS